MYKYSILFTEFPSQSCSVFLSFISLISLFFLLNNSNPYASTIESVNSVKLDHNNMNMRYSKNKSKNFECELGCDALKIYKKVLR